MKLSRAEIHRRALCAAAAAAGAGVLACSSPTGGDGGPAAGGADDIVGDVAGAEDAAVDAGAQVKDAQDAAAAGDAAVLDTTADSGGGHADTSGDAQGDTSKADTSPTDTAATDTAATDTAVADATAGCPPLEKDQPDCRALQGKPEWATCCDDHMKWCQTKHGEDINVVNACQFGADFSGKCTGCIPWGPPAPPEMQPLRGLRVRANGPVFEVA